MGYLTEATDAEELSSLSASDAARFRDYLIGKGMTAASVRRVFGTVIPHVIEQIGGWSTTGIGHAYGRGYSVKILAEWMERIKTSFLFD